nr:MAG: L1 protein [Arctocephalus gazella papillomavirus 2]
MSLWLPKNNKVYLPPTAVSRVISTDEYVTRLPLYYHATTERLLSVGHPFFPILGDDSKVKVPKVTGNQYRVFRIKLPDPNKFGLPDSTIFDPDKQRLVWSCTGIEVGRGQPLGIGATGHPLFNRYEDAENPGKYNTNNGQDNRQNVAMDPKQTQLFLVGCHPPIAEHWGKGKACDSPSPAQGDCPPLELFTTVLQDGDMLDIGFGNIDFRDLQESKSDAPLDISQSVCKYPDYLKMTADQYGDPLFFYVKKEQVFSRHYFTRAGTVGDAVPDDALLKANTAQAQNTVGSSIYYCTPSGSLVTSDSQIFNRPYWLQKAQGHNNGVCWNNELFVTLADNTRNTNFTISVATQTNPTEYNASSFKNYLRHAEEYEVQVIMQLCRVDLTPDVLAYLHTMDPDILDNWELGITPPLASSLEDKYRYDTNRAVTCPAKIPPKEKVDKYDKLVFWNVDLSSKFSSELDQYPLGRKFILQTGIKGARRAPATGVKRSATSSSAPAAKRKRR